jgi:hypothetical protein
MPVFDKEINGITRLAYDRGRIAMVRMAFDEARAADPGLTLLINDFDLSSAYECLIEGVLEAGVQIDAIGLQTHMHKGYRGEEAILAAVDRFARYGLPLHMTESTIPSGDVMPPEIGDLNDYRIPYWRGLARRSAWSAPTGRRSRHTAPCVTSSRASGGWLRRRCEPTGRDGCG